MSFLLPKPKTPKVDIPVEPEDLSTSQEAVPVPWFWGKRLVAMRPCTDLLSQVTIKRDQKAGKK